MNVMCVMCWFGWPHKYESRVYYLDFVSPDRGEVKHYVLVASICARCGIDEREEQQAIDGRLQP